MVHMLRPLSRRDVLTRAVNLGGASLLGAASASAQRRQPNIVWITLDDLGHRDVGCYGQKQIQTPHIDSLAPQGTCFTDCYAGGAVCAPSRNVLTGRRTAR